jgi:hypothetical protein
MVVEREPDFLQGICLIALSVDKKIEFVGVVDGNGKLLAGKYRQNINDDTCFIKSGLFYSALVIPGLNICKKSVAAPVGKADIKLLELDNIKLAIAPLAQKNDRYLCVYLQPSASYKEIIPKIIDTV